MNVTARLIICECCQLNILSLSVCLSLSLISCHKMFKLCHDDTQHCGQRFVTSSTGGKDNKHCTVHVRVSSVLFC